MRMQERLNATFEYIIFHLRPIHITATKLKPVLF